MDRLSAFFNAQQQNESCGFHWLCLYSIGLIRSLHHPFAADSLDAIGVLARYRMCTDEQSPVHVELLPAGVEVKFHSSEASVAALTLRKNW